MLVKTCSGFSGTTTVQINESDRAQWSTFKQAQGIPPYYCLRTTVEFVVFSVSTFIQSFKPLESKISYSWSTWTKEKVCFESRDSNLAYYFLSRCLTLGCLNFPGLNFFLDNMDKSIFQWMLLQLNSQVATILQEGYHSLECLLRPTYHLYQDK